MENIVIGIILGAVLIGFVTLIVISVRLLHTITEMSTITKSVYISTNKIEQMSQAIMQACENFVDALDEAVKDTSDIKSYTTPPMFLRMFKSEDGKHAAPTFDGLVEKMKKDPTYQQMSESDIEELRKLFEDNSDEEDEDDNESNEPWKK